MLLDAPDYERPPSLWQRWRKRSVWQQIGIVFALSLSIFIAGYGCGRVIDCSPGQQDGQCGLGTFMGMLSGLFFGGGVFVFGTLAVVSDWLWMRRRSSMDRAFSATEVQLLTQTRPDD